MVIDIESNNNSELDVTRFYFETTHQEIHFYTENNPSMWSRIKNFYKKELPHTKHKLKKEFGTYTVIEHITYYK